MEVATVQLPKCLYIINMQLSGCALSSELCRTSGYMTLVVYICALDVWLAIRVYQQRWLYTDLQHECS